MDASTMWVSWDDQVRRYLDPISGSSAVSEPGGFMALSGLPVPDFNHVGVYQPSRARVLTERYTEHLTATDTQAILLVAPEAGPHAAGPASAAGLREVGTMRVMGRSAADLPDGDAPDVEMLGAEHLTTFTEAMSDAFEMSPNIWETFGAATLGTAVARVYGIREDGELQTSVSTTGHGAVVGIWCMGTRTSAQRRGLGGRLLAEVLRREAAAGAEAFFLGASPVGEHLYERLGFDTIVEPILWLRGDSPEFPG